MNANYLCRFNVSPVDEYLSTREKVQLSTRVQFSLLVSTLAATSPSSTDRLAFSNANVIDIHPWIEEDLIYTSMHQAFGFDQSYSCSKGIFGRRQ